MFKELVIENRRIKFLDVPYVTQYPQLMYCFVASMKMSWDYIRATLGKDKDPLIAPLLAVEQIADMTRTDPLTGTQLGHDFLNEFNQVQKLVKAELVEDVSLERAEAAAAQGLPAILCYFPSICENPTASYSGAGHACVYLFHTSKDVTIHNPWYGPYHKWQVKHFDASRDLIGKAAILFEKTGQTTMRSFGGESNVS